MRRIPSAIASFKDAGATTLSTRRRASSKRSSAGSSSAARDTSVETIGEGYPRGSAKQAVVDQAAAKFSSCEVAPFVA